LALPHTHTTPSCLQVEEEDERKKDSGRAHEVELLYLVSCSCSPLYRQTVKVRIYKVWLYSTL